MAYIRILWVSLCLSPFPVWTVFTVFTSSFSQPFFPENIDVVSHRLEKMFIFPAFQAHQFDFQRPSISDRLRLFFLYDNSI